MVNAALRKMMLALLVAGLVPARLTQDAYAGVYEDGLDAYRSGNYPKALTLWRRLAALGHADAQFQLGYMYARGKGAPHDEIESAMWYFYAAEQGDLYSQVHLGLYYQQGEGIPEELVQAYKWFGLAAKGAKAEGDREVWQDASRLQRDTATRLSKDQIEEGERLIRTWRPKSDAGK
ncbi:MAG: sel1 repeat family protein [Alphaproteobacteria bacterium]|nr:sel1 repeat family protein [Alphaproteobacteria bacterium]